MRHRALVTGLGALALVVSVATGAGAGGTSPAPTRLTSFADCSAFGAFMRAHATPLVGRYGPHTAIAAGAMPAAPGKAGGPQGATNPAFSGTNVQEEGVDEPDSVKTDGRTLFVAGAGRVSAIDVRSGAPKLIGTLPLRQGATFELLLRGDRLLALSRQVTVRLPGRPTLGSPILPVPVSSSLTEIDVSRPTSMRVVRTIELEGSYLTARLIGSTARIVVASAPLTELPLVPSGGAAADASKAAEQNRNVVRSASATSWLPRYTVRGARGAVTRTGHLVRCHDVLRPKTFSGVGLVTILTVDLARGLRQIDSDALAASAEAVYASPSSLYVATTQPAALTPRGPIAGGGTTIHKFDISSPRETRYRGSGHVAGVLLDEWSLSEENGILRVASTSLPVTRGGAQTDSETSVTTFADRNGTLAPIGRVGGLGKGERVYAVRFAGDVGYVVTFRQIDPLYVVDLSTPVRPRVRGELALRGYSAYLHPLGGGLLLGVGQDATREGRTLGTLASLFDVSDPARPKRLDAFTLARTRSAVEYDHHAFLWWPRAQLAVLPVEEYLDRPFLGAVGLRVRRTGITEVGRVVHPAQPGAERVGSPGAPISRALVVGDTLYTISASGVKGSSLATFADRGFVRLPADHGGSLPRPKLPPIPPTPPITR